MRRVREAGATTSRKTKIANAFFRNGYKKSKEQIEINENGRMEMRQNAEGNIMGGGGKTKQK